ncbi:electron transfer flavoprotein subunit beta/FixA family protein [Compostibacter hankyongensis]|uniref:Electron transfer flavoprotein subunit beta n=1 Tax=Compostibacter hankyongensis TaxID=1007089 RepID=A0ABP8FKT9_9BACT
MKLLVCISKTPDTTARIAFTDNDTRFDESGIQFIINPYDEWYALVRALELKEQSGGELHILTVGGADTEPIIRKALALGGDEAIRINAESTDGFFIASQIAPVIREGGYDLVLTGKETIDYNGSALGGMIAALSDLPYISLATSLDVSEGTATLRRETEGGEEVCTVSLPAVVSCMKGMAEQRIPNMRGIMAARSKPLKVLEPVAADTLTTVVCYEQPAPKGAVKMIDPGNEEELVRLLHEEAKVI